MYRDFDMSVSVQMSNASYVHTQRYFSDLLNYWLSFLELVETWTGVKAAVAGDPVSPVPGILVIDCQQLFSICNG